MAKAIKEKDSEKVEADQSTDNSAEATLKTVKKKKKRAKLKIVSDADVKAAEPILDEDGNVVEPENPIITQLKRDFSRYVDILNTKEMDAVLLVKKWISEGEKLDVLALKAISQQLEETLMYKIFQKLSESERQTWKDNVDGFLKVDDLIIANKYISEEVIRDLIAPQGIKDMELIDLLLSLDVEIAVRFMNEKEDDAATLLNLLQPRQSAKILDKVEYEQSKSLIEKSLLFDFSFVTDDFASFKETLKDFIKGASKKPFNVKILQMLPNFNPAKEKMLYNVLAKDNLVEDMKSAAISSFPSELIGKLPPDLLKQLMQDYPQEVRIQLLASLDEEMKNLLLSSFAAEGSAAREMIDLEFENLENDPAMQSRLKSMKDVMWKDFIAYARKNLRTDEKFAGDVELIVTDWVEGMCQESKAA